METLGNNLDELMEAVLQPGGRLVEGQRELFMEVMDTETGLVWMSAAPVQMADFEALDVEAPLVKVSCALASMDRAAFQFSPAAPGESVRQREISGRLYINVAAPRDQRPSPLPGGPVQISVDKAHVLGFEAGRDVVILRLPEGDFVETVGDDCADNALVLPEGGELLKLELDRAWLVELPSPTRAFFWFDQGMRSFQGPVVLPNGH